MEPEDEQFVCPVCGTSNTHIHSVEVHQQKYKTTINVNGDFLAELEPHDRKGSVVIISFFCETGHRFKETTEFADDVITRTYTQHDDIKAKNGILRYPTELWRE